MPLNSRITRDFSCRFATPHQREEGSFELSFRASENCSEYQLSAGERIGVIKRWLHETKCQFIECRKTENQLVPLSQDSVLYWLQQRQDLNRFEVDFHPLDPDVSK